MSIFPRLPVLLAAVALTIVVGCGGHSSHQDDNSVGDVTLQTTSSCGGQTITMTSSDKGAFSDETQVYFQSGDGQIYSATQVTPGGSSGGNKLTFGPSVSMPEGSYSVLLAKGRDSSPTSVGVLTYNPNCPQQ